MNRSIILVSILAFAASPAAAEPQTVFSGNAASVSLDPFDSVWQQAAPAFLPTAPQKLVVPTGGGAVAAVEARSLRTADALYLRLSWPDATRSEDLELSGQFVDGVAVEFPLEPGTMPSPLMGGKGEPVNVWRWSAAMDKPAHYPKAYSDYYRPDGIHKTIQYPGKPEDLIAEGWGTITRREAQAVEGTGVWRGGAWTVVLKRPLSSAGGAEFKSGAVLPIAVAVWEGGSKERGPQKSFSVWHNLALDAKEPSIPVDPVAHGGQVYGRFGCASCHGKAGAGGVANRGSQVDPMPGLTRVAEGFTKDEIVKVILNGRQATPKDVKGIPPAYHMNSWKSLMSETEVRALSDYLFSLMPKGAEGDSGF